MDEQSCVHLIAYVREPREQGDAKAMVMAAAELDRILGCLPTSGADGQASRGALRRLEVLPDQELVADLGSNIVREFCGSGSCTVG